MHLLNDSHKLLIVAFLVATMFSIGLSTAFDDLRTLFASRAFVLRALLTNLVVVPLIGFAVAHLMPIPEPSKLTIILLACVPGGLGAAQFTSKVAGGKSNAGAMIVLLSIAAIVVSPLVLHFALPPGVDLALPYGRVLGVFALCVIVPLAVGVALCERNPGIAPALAKITGLIGIAAFIGFSILAKDLRSAALKSLDLASVGAMLLFIVASMAAGWLMGGGRREYRQILATSSSMRNAALCLVIARNATSGAAVMPALIAFSLLMVPPNGLLTFISTLRIRRSAAREKEGGQARAS